MPVVNVTRLVEIILMSGPKEMPLLREVVRQIFPEEDEEWIHGQVAGAILVLLRDFRIKVDGQRYRYRPEASWELVEGTARHRGRKEPSDA